MAGRGEDGIDAVAEAAFEIVAVHAVLGLDVADVGFDSCTMFHLAQDGSRDAADLPEIQILRRCGWLWPRYPLSTWIRRASKSVRFSMLDHWPSVCPSERPPCSALGTERELSAVRGRHGGGDTDLAANS